MKMTNEEYAALVKSRAPRSPLGRDMLLAFLFGGAICCVGQGITDLYLALGLEKADAQSAASMSMVLLGVILTALGVYDDLARLGGGGTLVPITGFANSVASPALEFRAEGLVTGMAVKMFSIAGPVIVFGVGASIVYGIILVILGA